MPPYGSAMIVHGSEINDFIPSAFVQPGPAVVGVAFALAENRGGSGSDRAACLHCRL